MTHRRTIPLLRPLLAAGPLLLLAATFAATLAPPAALAEPPDDPSSIWTLQDENAAVSFGDLTDRYYTNGLRLGWTSPTGAVPAPLVGLGRALWGDGKQRISFDLQQQIYTSDNTKALVPPVGDRPYAGVLMGTLSLVQDTDTHRSTFALGLGVVGPWALGEEIQNGFHDLIGQAHNNGWGSQIHNQPAIQITSSRVWRLDVGQVGGMQIQALPELTAEVGTVRVDVLSGVTIRIGQGLNADYGVARPRPGMSGGDAFTPTQPFTWYVFAGFDGRAVAHDITIDGNFFQNSHSTAERQPWVAEAQGGIALIWHGVRITYTQVVQTAEIRHQKGGVHEMGSLALSVRF